MLLKVSTVAAFWHLDTNVLCGGFIETANILIFKATSIGCMNVSV